MTDIGELAYLDLMAPDFRPDHPTCTPPAPLIGALAPRWALPRCAATCSAGCCPIGSSRRAAT
jgi:hypothetical protein